MNADIDIAPPEQPPLRIRIFRRDALETIASAVIAAGVIMLMQPFSIVLYGWSFVTTLLGTLLFTLATRFPE
jgi:VIT1/CCC1 family predicted Fe2+/Mn2+ transporter